MASPQSRRPAIRAEIVENPEVLGGRPSVAGTRIPASVVVAQIRAGLDDEAIFRHYPGLPVDGIDAVRAWAAENRIDLSPEASE